MSILPLTTKGTFPAPLPGTGKPSSRTLSDAISPKRPNSNASSGSLAFRKTRRSSNLPSGANPNASLDVSNLSAGSHQITGLYSGDQYFASATSAPLTQIVNLQGLGLAIGTGGSSSNTVSAGGTASYNRSIGGAGFSGVATIACSLALTG